MEYKLGQVYLAAGNRDLLVVLVGHVLDVESLLIPVIFIGTEAWGTQFLDRLQAPVSDIFCEAFDGV